MKNQKKNNGLICMAAQSRYFKLLEKGEAIFKIIKINGKTCGPDTLNL